MALKNFDKIIREKREIQVGGEVADVTRIPSRVMLELVNATDSGEISEDNPASFDKILNLVEKVCTPSNPKMTAAFLLDSTDFDTLIEIVEYVMSPVEEAMEKQQQKQLEAMQKKRDLMAQAAKKKGKK